VEGGCPGTVYYWVGMDRYRRTSSKATTLPSFKGAAGGPTSDDVGDGAPLSRRPYSEEELVRHARDGDHSAVEALYGAHYDQVYRYVFFRVGCPHAAEDVTSAVFMAMVKGLPRYKHTGKPFLAWLYAIAQKQVAYFHRGNSRKKTELDLEAAAEMLADTAGPDATLEERERSRRLAEALRELPATQREVLLMRFVLSLPLSEAAAVLDRSEGAVKQLQMRALAGLRDILGDHRP